jgi:hypothetical protein
MADTQLSIIATLQDQVSGKLSGIRQGAESLKGALLGAAAQITAAFGAGKLIQGIVSVNAEFDKLEAQIRTFSGSAEEAEAAMAMIQEVATQTPFQLTEVTQAFARMKALGLDPTKEALLAFGDVAAGTGKSIIQFTEAVADASVGEFERLKEFGIKASKEGEKVNFTFKGITQEVAFNSQEIQKYLMQLSETQFGGAMAAQMDTFSGAISNMQDQFALLGRAIGEAGVNEAIATLAKFIGNLAKTVLDNVDVIQGTWIGMGTNLLKVAENVRYGFVQFGNGMKLVFGEMVNYIKSAWNGLVDTLVAGVNVFASVIPGMEKINGEALKMKTNTAELLGVLEQESQLHQRNLALIEESYLARIDEMEAKKKVNQYTVNEIAANEKLSTAVTKTTQETKTNTAETDKNTTAKKNNVKAANEQMTVFQKMIAEIKGNRVEVQQTNEAYDLLADAYKRGEINATEYGQAIIQLNTKLGLTRVEAEKVKTAAKDVGTEFETTAERSKRAVEDISTASGRAFGDIISQSGSLASSLASLFSELFNYIFKSTSSTTSAVGSFISSAIGSLGNIFRADGGPVSAMKPYIVGERGPELFVPRTSGNIVSNENLGQFSRGGSQQIVNNWTIQALDGADVMRVLTRNRREISEMVSGTTQTFRMG